MGIVLIFFLILLGIIPGLRKATVSKANLEFWGVDDNSGVWNAAISNFKQLNPNTSIRYRPIDESSYEKELLDALAAGKGPDVFMFKNTWLTKHGNKIYSSLPEQINLKTFRDIFPEAPETDFVSNDQISSVPTSIDTLALFYNKNIFNNKKIALPPTTWDEFKADILKSIEFKNGKISKSGAAMGGSLKSVENATDILNLIMFQTGTQMTDSTLRYATFGSPAGESALNFYTSFSDPKNKYYTWDDSFSNSIDSFAEGRVAMIFGYYSDAEKIKTKNPFLNFGIAPVPQFDKSTALNFPSYWGLAVSTKSLSPKIAWDFIAFASTNEESMKSYSSLTGKSPALRSLINVSLSDINLGVFAGQSLSAKSWREPDDTLVKESLNNAIIGVITKKLSSDQALGKAQSEITNLMQGK